MTVLRLAPADVTGARTDALVIAIVIDPRRESKINVPDGVDLGLIERRRLVDALHRVGARAKADEVTKLPGVTGFAAPLIVAVGLGCEVAEVTDEIMRRATGAGVRAVAGTDKVAIAMPATQPASVAAVGQGALLGAYSYESCRGAGTPSPTKPVRHVAVLTTSSRDRHVKEAFKQAEIVAQQVLLARDLVNAPPSALHPKELADAGVKAVAGLDVTTEILDEVALASGAYGGILAVGQGSANPPRLLRLEYRPARARVHIALVGKGITFDSGGLSIKPAAAMETMKCDMGGAAAVIAATVAIARLGINASVTTYAACAENMPSGTAQRPGDVLTTYGGTTVEVLNTDAEGRLVLADALVRAGEDNPDVIVDVATLTGAQTVALGNRVCAVMSNDDELRDDVLRAATVTGEQFWPMPLPPELRASLDSPIADLANIGDRLGGMLTAGLFLQEFVAAGTPWAHLDIAGPAFNEGEARDYTSSGGTGVAVRTLVQLVRDLVDSHTR